MYYLCITYSYLYVIYMLNSYIFFKLIIFLNSIKNSDIIIKLLSTIIELKLDNLENNFLYLTLLLKSI